MGEQPGQIVFQEGHSADYWEVILGAHSRVQMVGHKLEQLKGWKGRDNGQNLGKYISFGMRITSVCLQTEEPVEEGRVCRPWKRRDQQTQDDQGPRVRAEYEETQKQEANCS